MISYRNGNYIVKIGHDGTKTRRLQSGSVLTPLFPESVDLKITNRCDLGCPFCYENSTPTGIHAFYSDIENSFRGLPQGVEVAIGGGNPLCHPNIESIIRMLNRRGFLPSITVNEEHLTHVNNRNQLQDLIDAEVLYGIGVSLSPTWRSPRFNLVTNNLVAHVIAGVHSFDTIKSIRKHYKKVLILGYKHVGGGQSFFGPKEAHKIKHLKDNLWEFFYSKKGTGIIAFDNAAIEQLEVWKHFSPERWAEFYMGDDGDFTCYYDAVTKNVKESSISNTGVSFVSILEGFEILKKMKDYRIADKGAQ